MPKRRIVPDDETTVIPPDLAPTQARAYSDAVDYDDPSQTDTQLNKQLGTQLGPASWGLTWGIAGLLLAAALLIVGVAGATVVMFKVNHPARPPIDQTTQPAAPIMPTADVHQPPPSAAAVVPAPPPTPAQAFAGRYNVAMTDAKGHTAQQAWDVTPCGDTCVRLAQDGYQPFVNAHLFGNTWVYDSINNETGMCLDRSLILNDGSAHGEIDATTLRGTEHVTWDMSKQCPNEIDPPTTTSAIVMTRTD
jgi:hypothetical protein